MQAVRVGYVIKFLQQRGKYFLKDLARLIFVGAVTIGAVTVDVLAQRAARRAELRAR